MNPNPKGECMEMCPEAEINLREKERLLHILETLPGTEGNNKPLADRKRVVKCFSRSAAGKHLLDPKNLRPPSVLLKTVCYLIEEILENKKIPWHFTYDFIMDRLRAVRQDMVIQNLSVAESICILQPIVRFYAYSAYRLCDAPIAQFDPHLNQTHLQECLKRLLYLYDECDLLFDENNKVKNSYCIERLKEVRPSFEALYQIFNLGSATALTRALNLPKQYRNRLVILAMTISLNYNRNNFVKVCYKINELPVLLQALAATHLPEIRRRALRIMSVAYNSKNLSFPLHVIKTLLLYKNVEDVISDCIHFGLKCTKTDVQFVKINFDDSKVAVQPTHLDFIDQTLKNIELSELLLNG